MGVFVLIVSLIALFAVSGGPSKMGFHTPMSNEYLAIPKRTFERPARKSMIVDTDGLAHRTADGTQMTKRDRAKMILLTPRTFEYKIPEVVPQVIPPSVESVATPVVLPVSEPAPNLDVVTQAETKTVEDLSVPMMSSALPTVLSVEGSEGVSDPAMNQKILSAIVAQDGNLSEWARTTLRCSFRDGLVILYGVVRDEQEKQRIADLAKSLPDVVTVENQLNAVDTEVDTAPVLTQ